MGRLVHRTDRALDRQHTSRTAPRGRIPGLRSAHVGARPVAPPRPRWRTGHPASLPVGAGERTRRDARSRRPRRRRRDGGRVAGAVGLDIDVAIVLGAAEGTLPPRPTSDPLLTDAERADAGAPDVRRPHAAAAPGPRRARGHDRAHVHGASGRSPLHRARRAVPLARPLGTVRGHAHRRLAHRRARRHRLPGQPHASTGCGPAPPTSVPGAISSPPPTSPATSSSAGRSP